MKEYSPGRRTALVFTGTGTTGAYHAGALRALDEGGVRIDLVVGSGAGALTAAYAAVMGGPKLYGAGGFWHGVRRSSFYRLRPALRLTLALLVVSSAIFVLPLVLASVLGALFPLLLIGERVVPGSATRLLAPLWVAPQALSGVYLTALAIPVLAVALLAVLALAVLYLRGGRRRVAEALESLVDVSPALERLRAGLREVAKGAALEGRPTSDAELGRRFVAMLCDNLGQPGFRELLLRTADLDTGGVLRFGVLREPPARDEELMRGPGALAETVDLRVPGQDALLFEAVATGLLAPIALPLRRVTFPKGGAHGGETHRLTDATLCGGAGIAEALASGADQVILVTGVPEEPAPLARRRGPFARLDAVARSMEREAVRELGEVERLNRIVATLGHWAEGRRAWQDPASGRVLREASVWVIRPGRRLLGPMELDGAQEPATEVWRTVDDLIEQGYRDAREQFVEPVVGASSIAEREEGRYSDTQPVGL